MIGGRDTLSLALTELLLQYDPKLDIANKKGETALLIAVDQRRLPVAKALVQKGADVTIGYHILMRNLYQNDFEQGKELFCLLQQAGADFECYDEHGQRDIHVALYSYVGGYVKLLLDAGVDVATNSKMTLYGYQTLFFCRQHPERTSVLLAHPDIDVNKLDSYGNNVLFHYCSSAKESIDSARLLLQAVYTCIHHIRTYIVHTYIIRIHILAINCICMHIHTYIYNNI